VDVSTTLEKGGTRPPALAGIKVIDADTHLTEPADLWTSRAPAKYRDRVPRIVSLPGQFDPGTGEPIEGLSTAWVIDDDVVLGQAGAGCQINRDNQKVRGSIFTKWPLSEASPAASFVGPRLELMDDMGIWAQIVYPNVVGFGGHKFGNVQDGELRNLCATIYNDAMIELAVDSEGRLNGMAVLPWWDVKKSAAEAERVHGLGLKGVNISADPQLNFGLPDLADPHWEPLWDACEGLGLPINFHIGASQTQASWFGGSPWPSLNGGQKLALGSACVYLSNARVIGNLIYSGVLERHPNLKFVSVESGVGWIPFMLEALDYQASETSVGSLKLSMKPSEYFRRQIYACFWFESDRLLEDVERLGYDKCLFETDFPHPTCLFPDPLSQIAEILIKAPFDVRRKLLSENAASVYNITVPDDEAC
jgi:predicted TIM-barrel fold metal-dependent hydrolase